MIKYEDLKNVRRRFYWDGVVYYGTCEYNNKKYWFSSAYISHEEIGEWYKFEYDWKGDELIAVEREINKDTLFRMYELTFWEKIGLIPLKDERIRNRKQIYDEFIWEHNDYELETYYEGKIEDITPEQQAFINTVKELE